MKEIELSQGKTAIVDDGDFEWLSQWKWSYSSPKRGKGYAYRRAPDATGKWKGHFMHRDIMGNPKGLWVDHINGNGLDNRRENLRIVSPRQNNENRRLSQKNQSRFKGVSWIRARGKWRATIDVGKETRHIGAFDTPEDAARAYDAMARELFGEFACTNEELGLLKPVSGQDTKAQREEGLKNGG